MRVNIQNKTKSLNFQAKIVQSITDAFVPNSKKIQLKDNIDETSLDLE